MENQNSSGENSEVLLVAQGKKTLITQVILLVIIFLLVSVSIERIFGGIGETVLFPMALASIVTLALSIWSFILAMRGIRIGLKLGKLNKPNWVLHLLSWLVLILFLYKLATVITHSPAFF